MRPTRHEGVMTGISFDSPEQIAVLSAVVHKGLSNPSLSSLVDIEISRIAFGEKRIHPSADGLDPKRPEIIIPSEFAGELIVAIVALSISSYEAELRGVDVEVARSMIEEYWESCDLGNS